MKKNKKNRLLALAALICALAALVVAVLAMTRIPEDRSGQIQELQAENARLAQQVTELEGQVEQLMTVVNLQSWTLDVEAWPDSTGADVTLSATPSYYREGVSATMLVLLEGDQVASVPCHWTGTVFTATASLSAADGYSYYCLLSAPGSTQQLSLTGPNSPEAGIPVYLQASLSAYCNLVVNSWTEKPGGSLMLTDAYAQVQLPRISAAGEAQVATAELVLRLNGVENARLPLMLTPSEVTGSMEKTIRNQKLPMPVLTQGDSLELSLEVTLTDGRRLSAFGIAWNLEDEQLSSAVG